MVTIHHPPCSAWERNWFPRVAWLALALMWYSYLGLALAAGEQGGLLGAALANPVLAAALPVAAAHVTVAVEEVAMDLGLAYIGPDDAGDEPGTDTRACQRALCQSNHTTGVWPTGACIA